MPEPNYWCSRCRALTFADPIECGPSTKSARGDWWSTRRTQCCGRVDMAHGPTPSASTLARYTLVPFGAPRTVEVDR